MSTPRQPRKKVIRWKKRAPQGIEAILSANPAARKWLHAVLPTFQSYREIVAELKRRFGITSKAQLLSDYYRRHLDEIRGAPPAKSNQTVHASIRGLEITITVSCADVPAIAVKKPARSARRKDSR